MIWATVSFRSYFCWLYRASPSSTTKNIINLILVLTILWCPCVELFLVVVEKGVCYDQYFFLTRLSLFPSSFYTPRTSSVLFSSVTQSCLTLCDPMNHSTPGIPVHHQLPEFTHVHRVGDAIQPSHPLSSPSPTPNTSQHQGLFQWVNSSHEVAKVLEFQPQYQSFQWTPRTDLL